MIPKFQCTFEMLTCLNVRKSHHWIPQEKHFVTENQCLKQTQMNYTIQPVCHTHVFDLFMIQIQNTNAFVLKWALTLKKKFEFCKNYNIFGFVVSLVIYY